MKKYYSTYLAAGMLFLMFVLAITSLKDESLTMDELAHLPAGYSYLTQQDMRLNPEHPPLVKDLAGFPLLFIDGINFPKDIKAWAEDTNGQWEFGSTLLFNSNNPADAMIFFGRLPMILLTILLGIFIFKITKEKYGDKAALLATFFYALSPTFIAHGRLVTTDVGAAFGVLTAIYYFVKSLQNPTKKNILLAGTFFGLAQLLKFSAILLLPLFGVLAIIWWLVVSKKFFVTLKTSVLVIVIGFLLIWPVYQFHVWNYPPEKQARDTAFYLVNYHSVIKDPVVWSADKPVLRPYTQYLTGLLMIFSRTAGGNTTYFLGQISNQGWKLYFPAVYLLKETLALHVLTLIALLYILWKGFRSLANEKLGVLKSWVSKYYLEFAMLSFIGLYWLTSITGNLNIGVRHLMPVIPLTIVLVSAITASWLKPPYLKAKYAFLALLIVLQSISVITSFPHYIAYFNELAGSENGYKYVVDSNVDWGQDLKRLRDWTDQNQVDQIYVDYFGGSSPQYYLQDKYARWWGSRNPEELPKGSLLAVSATFLQDGRGQGVQGYPYATGFYRWLESQELIARIGHSIFVFRIN